jgi:hypothetical protein
VRCRSNDPAAAQQIFSTSPIVALTRRAP